MITSFASLFVQNPAAIAAVAGLFFGAYLLAHRSSRRGRSGWLLLPAVVWALWALWELNIVLFSPEADIRVDLLLIVPLVLAASVIGGVMLFVPRRPPASA